MINPLINFKFDSSFEKNGNIYYLKKVKRRKEATCKVCLKEIKVKEEAIILRCCTEYIEDWTHIVGIFHLDCYPNFVFEKKLFKA